MILPIVPIGNSKGIRLPKPILQQYNIADEVELELGDFYIILRPKRKVREGWAEAFKSMHENGDDQLLVDDVFEDENFPEW